MDADELRRMVRQHAPMAFKVLAEIADDPEAKPRERAKAQRGLNRRIPQLRALCRDPSISPDDRRDMEALLKKLGG